MKNDTKFDASERIGRRHTLTLLGAAFAAGGLVAAGCKPKSEGSGEKSTGAASTANDCNATIDDTSQTTRKLLQYNSKAAVPANHCSVCAQYTAGTFGDCGGCKLFTGPVQPNGGCLSFAPIGDSAAAPAKSG